MRHERSERSARGIPPLTVRGFAALQVLVTIGLLAVPESAAAAARPAKTRPAAVKTQTHVSRAAPGTAEERIELPLLGECSVYRPEPIAKTRGVVLFVSGDGGWNLGVVDMANRAAPKALVVGLSMRTWQKIAEKNPGSCWYPAGELETIAQAVEKKYGFPRYLKPILVGYSSGATVVYGVLAQSPPESFSGAISLGFCPDLDVNRPLCGRDAWKPEWVEKKRLSLLPPREDLAPRTDRSARWIAFQGQIDQVCDPKAVGEFAEKIPAARVISLPKVGHGFSVPRNWGAEYDAAVDSLLDPVSAWEPLPAADRHTVPNHSPAEITARLEALDLPLEIQWPEGAREAVIFVSGDGGWAELDQKIAAALDAQGIAVVGWNTLRYFWKAKTPAVFRADLVRLLAAIPPEINVFAGGYSFGAEVIPVTVAGASSGGGAGGSFDAAEGGSASPRMHAASGGGSDGALADDPLSRIAGLVLLGPGRYATFEVSPLDWIRTSDAPSPHPVGAALASTKIPTLCLDSAQEKDTGCPEQSEGRVIRVVLKGGHHFGGDYEGIARRIAEFVRGAAGEAQAPGPDGGR